MQPFTYIRCYTELFFLDEATALAAGHRPCWECQRQRNRHFREAWFEAHRNSHSDRPLRMSDMDNILHQERLTQGWLKKNRHKQTYPAVLETLPSGAFVDIKGKPHLLWESQLLPWTPGGYDDPISHSLVDEVAVLTPPSIVRVLGQGYVPIFHVSLHQKTERE